MFIGQSYKHITNSTNMLCLNQAFIKILRDILLFNYESQLSQEAEKCLNNK